jgi:ABC-2 type transport system permease protein
MSTGTRTHTGSPQIATPPASARQVVGLVAHREITTRLRSKAFLIATVASVVILVALSVILKLVAGSPSTIDVGVTPSTASLGPQLVASASAVGAHVRTQAVTSDAAGRDAVRDGKLDGMLVGDGQRVQVVVKTDIDPNMRSALQVLAGRVALNQQISALGGDPTRVSAAVGGATVSVQSLVPPSPKHSQQIVLGIVAGILIYLALMLSGQAVAQGVVEEKSSRVVELLLATVRPWQLMAGKVLGIGVVGLIQVAVIGIAGIVAGFATGSLSIQASAAASTIIWLVVWFLLGFVAYALAFAAVAALVSRQEDVASVVTPVLMFLIIGYVLGVSILPAAPDSSLIKVMSLIPLFAPTLMPMRIAMGGVPAWQLIVSVGGIVVLIPLLVWLAGRIYRNAVVRSGARVRLSDAWRPA